jgi:hypothetical protein
MRPVRFPLDALLCYLLSFARLKAACVVSCAQPTGDPATESVPRAEKTRQNAVDIYRATLVRGEAELCLDPFNPPRLIQKSSFRMDVKALWRRYSLKEIFMMWQDVKAFGAEDNGLPRRTSGKLQSKACSTTSATGATRLLCSRRALTDGRNPTFSGSSLRGFPDRSYRGCA